MYVTRLEICWFLELAKQQCCKSKLKVKKVTRIPQICTLILKLSRIFLKPLNKDRPLCSHAFSISTFPFFRVCIVLYTYVFCFNLKFKCTLSSKFSLMTLYVSFEGLYSKAIGLITWKIENVRTYTINALECCENSLACLLSGPRVYVNPRLYIPMFGIIVNL